MLSGLLACSADVDQKTAAMDETNLRGSDLQAAMYGTWEEIALEVNTNFESEEPDSISTFLVTEEMWETTLQVKPARTYFSRENKYQQIFKGLDEIPYDTIKGLWQVIGDTLTMISPEATYQYEVELAEGIMRFRTIIDWDGDDALDDEYVASKRLISKSVN